MQLTRTLQNRRKGLHWGALFSTGLFLAVTVCASDWPTYMHDNRRSGVADESLKPPLTKSWVYSSPTPPQSAWEGPARWDAYAGIKDLEPMRNFDPAFFTTAWADSVYFGSSVDDAVHCLDAETGQTRWLFFTEGPVRFPPAFHRGMLYFGSDDGFVYCVKAEDGLLVWKYKPDHKEAFIPCKGKLISLWPCRTSVLVQSGKAYFGASLLPWRRSFICAVDAETGSDKGPGCYMRTSKGLTMQGAILATRTRLYQPQGRQRPELFDLRTGKSLGGIGKSGNGGCYAVITKNNVLFHGRGQNHRGGGELRASKGGSTDYIFTFPGANCTIATDKMAYFTAKGTLSAFNLVRYLALKKKRRTLTSQKTVLKKKIGNLQKKGQAKKLARLREELRQIDLQLSEIPKELEECTVWKTACPLPHSLILAKDILFAGGTDTVRAYEKESGRLVWKAEVPGKAHGLTVANGRLFVSTGSGHILCFCNEQKNR